YVVIDAANIALWQGSGSFGSTVSSKPARSLSGAPPRFESWQVQSAIKAVESSVAGLGIQVVSSLPEEFLRHPERCNVQDPWVLAELRRQGKLQPLPSGADSQVETLRLAQLGDT